MHVPRHTGPCNRHHLRATSGQAQRTLRFDLEWPNSEVRLSQLRGEPPILAAHGLRSEERWRGHGRLAVCGLAALVVLGVAAVVWTSYGESRSGQAAPAPRGSIGVTVTTAVAAAGSRRTRADPRAELHHRRHGDGGQRAGRRQVKAGQVLAQIDPTDAQARWTRGHARGWMRRRTRSTGPVPPAAARSRARVRPASRAVAFPARALGDPSVAPQPRRRPDRFNRPRLSRRPEGGQKPAAAEPDGGQTPGGRSPRRPATGCPLTDGACLAGPAAAEQRRGRPGPGRGPARRHDDQGADRPARCSRSAGTVGADVGTAAPASSCSATWQTLRWRPMFSEADVGPAGGRARPRRSRWPTGRASSRHGRPDRPGRDCRRPAGPVRRRDRVRRGPGGPLLGQSANVAGDHGGRPTSVRAPRPRWRRARAAPARSTVQAGGHGPQPRSQVGLRGDQYTQITSGLAEGDEVVPDSPHS